MVREVSLCKDVKEEETSLVEIWGYKVLRA